MRKTTRLIFGAACLVALLTTSTVALASDTAASLVREGVALHDKGDYDGAIAKYRAALQIDPENMGATYELVMTLYTKKDLREAEKIARDAAKHPSRLQAGFLMMLGNIDDDKGDLSAAINDYQEAIRQFPLLELAHFNLGVAYFRKGDLNEARAALEFEAANDPDHPGTHFILGRVYKQSGFRVPAVLALSRFLLSEPGTKRSSEARDLLEQLFTADVKVDSASSTTVTVDPNARKAEGDFEGADLMMALSQVTATIDPKSSPKDSPPLQFADLEPPVQRLASTLQMIAESAKQMKNGGFAGDFYVPFVVGLASSKQIEVFSRFAYSGAGLPKNDKWLSDHGAELGALQSWVKSFSWPKVSPRIQ